MDFSLQNTTNYFLFDTEVENLFLAKYMPDAPGDAVKVYLYALMHARYNLPMDNETVARKLGLSLDAVLGIWDYWEAQGIVRKTRRTDGSGICVEFLSIKESAFGRRSSVVQKSSQASAIKPDDQEYARLLRNVEACTGRLLESGEPEEIASWISDYGIDPEVILQGYKYSVEKGKSTRCRYVGTILKDWRAKGLSTVAEVTESLEGVDRNYAMYRTVMKELGFHRNPTEPEKRIMSKWFSEMGFSLERVLEACKRTTGISNPNINYVNSVLTAWSRESGENKPDQETENVFAKVEKLYEKQREENSRLTAENREKIFTQLPQLRSIVEEIKNSSIEVSKAMLSGGTGAVARQRARQKSLKEEKNRLLASAGYSPTALDAIYTCKICHDTGLTDEGTRCSCYDEKAKIFIKGTN